MKKAGWWFGFILLSLSLAQSVGTGSYVGKVENSQAFIAVILSSDQKVMAYTCDSADLAQWFTGKLENGGFKITLPNGRTLEGKLEGNAVIGSLGLEGKSFSFKSIASSGTAGLYRYAGDIEGNRYLGGWIVDQEGQQRGSVIGGGGLRASSITPQTLKSDHPSLANVQAWKVTPDWVSQNLSL